MSTKTKILLLISVVFIIISLFLYQNYEISSKDKSIKSLTDSLSMATISKNKLQKTIDYQKFIIDTLKDEKSEILSENLKLKHENSRLKSQINILSINSVPDSLQGKLLLRFSQEIR